MVDYLPSKQKMRVQIPLFTPGFNYVINRSGGIGRHDSFRNYFHRSMGSSPMVGTFYILFFNNLIYSI